MKHKVKALLNRYHYAWVIFRELVKTDFKLRYQGSFLGVLWSVLKPLMLFAVMYAVFVRFLKFSDGSDTFAISLLCGTCLWSFFNEATTSGMMSIVMRGDLLRKIHFPNYIIVMSTTMGAMISLGINLVVVIIFGLFSKAHFTWRVLLVPFNILQLYALAVGIALLLSTLYVHYRDIGHIWEVILQAMFYGIPIIYPISMVANTYPLISKVMLLNPVAQAIMDVRHNLLSPEDIPTVWTWVDNPVLASIPYILTIFIVWLGVLVFKKYNSRFAEVL